MRSRVLAVVLAAACPAGAEVVERVTAVVEERPVLLSEVRLFQALKGVDREAARQALVDERLMHREAARLPGTAATAEEEEKAYRSLQSRLGDQAAPFSEEEVRRIARRQVAILKYVEVRFRPQIRVDDAAVASAYAAQYGEDPAAPSLEEATEGLRASLEDEELGQRIEAWVRELRASADVRFNDL
ncbi:MAG TPA: hypothetical protein VII13_10610 [Vicinamibacteria bacterium]|jgi:hypothetical protein